MTHWHDDNPWADTAVYVAIEDLARISAGGSITLASGKSVPRTAEFLLAEWRKTGEKLDAYILPQPSGMHSIGIRFGEEDHEYLSPPALHYDVLAPILRRAIAEREFDRHDFGCTVTHDGFKDVGDDLVVASILLPGMTDDGSDDLVGGFYVDLDAQSQEVTGVRAQVNGIGIGRGNWDTPPDIAGMGPQAFVDMSDEQAALLENWLSAREDVSGWRLAMRLGDVAGIRPRSAIETPFDRLDEEATGKLPIAIYAANLHAEDARGGLDERKMALEASTPRFG